MENRHDKKSEAQRNVFEIINWRVFITDFFNPFNKLIYFHSLLRSLFSLFLCSFISLFVCCFVCSVDRCFVRLFSRPFLCLFLCLSSRAWICMTRLPMGPLPLEAPVRVHSCRPSPQTNATKEEKHNNSRTTLARSGSLRTKNDSSGCSGPRTTHHKIIRFQYITTYSASKSTNEIIVRSEVFT